MARTRARRGPREATPTYLRNSALHYLGRYATSSAHLRRLLLGKVERSARAHGTDCAAGAEAVASVIADLTAARLLDDGAYAEARCRSLHRRGASARAIRAALAAKGLAAELIDAALAQLHDTAQEPELAAALAYARRRRLGLYRSTETREAWRERDLAALGRQGFGYDLVRRIVEAEDPDELEAEAGAH